MEANSFKSMEANGFNKSASTRFVLTEETAEAIPAAFHPDRITFCPAEFLKCLYESDKILALLSYYVITVHNDRLHICTRFICNDII